MAAGRPYDITPTGMLALDVARIEAGLILLDVDYTGSKKALIPSQSYSPFEIGLGRSVHLDKAPFIGQAALRREAKKGPARQLVGPGRGLAGPGTPPRRGGALPRSSPRRRRGPRSRSIGTACRWGRPRAPPGRRPSRSSSLSPPSTSDAAAVGTRLGMEFTVDHQRKRWVSRSPSSPSSTRPASGPSAGRALRLIAAPCAEGGSRPPRARSRPPKKRSCISVASRSAGILPSGRNHL